MIRNFQVIVKSILDPDDNFKRDPLPSGIDSWSDNFEKKLSIKEKMVKYLKRDCLIQHEKQLKVKYFSKHNFFIKIFAYLSDHVNALDVKGLIICFNPFTLRGTLERIVC